MEIRQWWQGCKAFVVEVSEVGWGAGTHFPACLDAGDLVFCKACGGERGGPGWEDVDVSVKRCELKLMKKSIQRAVMIKGNIRNNSLSYVGIGSLHSWSTLGDKSPVS